MSTYDTWLEKPYRDADKRGEEIERYAEANDLPLEDDFDWRAAEAAMEADAEAAADNAADYYADLAAEREWDR